MLAASITPEFWVAIGALVTSFFGGIAVLIRLPGEKQTTAANATGTLVGAQDTVIENLREYAEDLRKELVCQAEEHAAQIKQLKQELATEREACDRQIAALNERLRAVERRHR